MDRDTMGSTIALRRAHPKACADPPGGPAGRRQRRRRQGEGSSMSKGTQYDLNWIVSVDDHVIEPPNVWVDRLPKKYQDVGPRVIRESDGNEFWVYEDKKMITGGLGAVAGRPPEDITIEGYPYSDMRAGCYDPVGGL